MRPIGIMCCALLLIGCSYSPEEQYRKCMSEFAPKIAKSEEWIFKFFQVDMICRVSAGMDVRDKDFISNLALLTPEGDLEHALDLLRQFGYKAE